MNEGDRGWIDVRAVWQRDAIVDDLPIGMIEDPRVGLLCGMYKHLDEYPCDACGRDSDVVAHDGRVLCGCCIEELLHVRDLVV